MTKTKEIKQTSGRRGRTSGSYSTQSVKLSELIEKLDPSSSVPINVRFCRIKSLSGELLEATAENIKSLAENKQIQLEKSPEIQNNNGIQVTDLNESAEIPAQAA